MCIINILQKGAIPNQNHYVNNSVVFESGFLVGIHSMNTCVCINKRFLTKVTDSISYKTGCFVILRFPRLGGAGLANLGRCKFLTGWSSLYRNSAVMSSPASTSI